MNRYFSIFLIFSFIALTAVAVSVYDSSYFKTDDSSAEGFGISPPYVQSENLKPGDTYTQHIAILRSEAKTAATAQINIAGPDFASWINIRQGKNITLAIGDYNTPMDVDVNVPLNAKPGVYKGYIYLAMATDEKRAGVGIRVGAMVDINLKVSGGEAAALVEERVPDMGIKNADLYARLKGRIIMRASSSGEAYYVSPDKQAAYYLGDPNNALRVIREQGIGISDKDLGKIPVSLYKLTGIDTDKDGLPDNFEIALKTNEKTSDTDNDGFFDSYELTNGFSPYEKNKVLPINIEFANAKNGKIFMQVESLGQAWYVNPVDSKRYFLATPDDTIIIMKSLALGISEENFSRLGVEN